MMTRAKITILFLLIGFFALVDAGKSQTIPAEKLARVVVFLRHQSQAYEIKGGERFEVWYKKQTGKEAYEPKLITQFGTGFIIRYEAHDYVVTAKHVAEFLSNDAELVTNVPAGKTISITFNYMEKSKKFPGAKWFVHPSADIAIHPIVAPQKIDHAHFPSNEIPETDESIPLLSTVYVVGFPFGLGVHDRLNPIAKKAQVGSTITSLEALNVRRDLKFLLLDQALAQGYSGAPVFYVEDLLVPDIRLGDKPFIKGGERIHLIGILAAQISDDKGGKISAVTPISYLWEILHSADFMKYQKNITSSP
jgi:S1-C subfamily serine protease